MKMLVGTGTVSVPPVLSDIRQHLRTVLHHVGGDFRKQHLETNQTTQGRHTAVGWKYHNVPGGCELGLSEANFSEERKVLLGGNALAEWNEMHFGGAEKVASSRMNQEGGIVRNDAALRI